MGTKNFTQDYINNKIEHSIFDIAPHFKDNDYKYVGILYERDMQDPDKFYIIDGQTGLPMNPKQVAEFPTTLSDMWKEKGLSCTKSDSEDVELKNTSLAKSTKAVAEGIKTGWEMGGPIGAIGGALGGGVAAGQITSMESNQKLDADAESQQIQDNQQEHVQNLKVEEIDMSNFEDLLKEQIVFVKALLAKGERATDGEIATYNARAGRILEEFKRIESQINSLPVSEEEKMRIAKEKVVTAKGLSERLSKLIDEVLKKKIIDHLVPIPFAESNNKVSQRNGGGVSRIPAK